MYVFVVEDFIERRVPAVTIRRALTVTRFCSADTLLSVFSVHRTSAELWHTAKSSSDELCRNFDIDLLLKKKSPPTLSFVQLRYRLFHSKFNPTFRLYCLCTLNWTYSLKFTYSCKAELYLKCKTNFDCTHCAFICIQITNACCSGFIISLKFVWTSLLYPYQGHVFWILHIKSETILRFTLRSCE